MKKTKIVSILVTILIITVIFSLLSIYQDLFFTSIKNSNHIEQNNENNTINYQNESENSDDPGDFDKILNNEETSQNNREKSYGKLTIRISYPVTSLNGKSLFSIPIPYTRIYLESKDGTIVRIGRTNLLGYKVFRFMPMDHDYIVTAYKRNYLNSESFVTMSNITELGFVNIFLN